MPSKNASPLPPPADVQAVLKILEKQYPSSETELTYEGPFQLLIAVILSAQCTDARVNMVTPALFARFPDAPSLAKASPAEVEKLIHSCGFFRAKTKAIMGTAHDISEKFEGKVPNTLEELTSLRGVGRKTASVVLNQAYDIPAIAVDTHVNRVSNRLGWANHADPVKVERQLKEAVPEAFWAKINMLLIWHGRKTCKSRKPLCGVCVITKYCQFFQTGGLEALKAAKAPTKNGHSPRKTNQRMKA